jgi:hypothetical protein
LSSEEAFIRILGAEEPFHANTEAKDGPILNKRQSDEINCQLRNSSINGEDNGRDFQAFAI